MSRHNPKVVYKWAESWSYIERALFITVGRLQSHVFHNGLWNMIPLGLSMVFLAYALFRPTDKNLSKSVVASAAALLYALAI